MKAKVANALDSAVEFIEAIVPWRRLWASRTLGVLVGWARLIAWTLPVNDGWQLDFYGRRCGFSWRARVAWAMWLARYWYEYPTEEEA